MQFICALFATEMSNSRPVGIGQLLLLAREGAAPRVVRLCSMPTTWNEKQQLGQFEVVESHTRGANSTRRPGWRLEERALAFRRWLVIYCQSWRSFVLVAGSLRARQLGANEEKEDAHDDDDKQNKELQHREAFNLFSLWPIFLLRVRLRNTLLAVGLKHFPARQTSIFLLTKQSERATWATQT